MIQYGNVASLTGSRQLRSAENRWHAYQQMAASVAVGWQTGAARSLQVVGMTLQPKSDPLVVHGSSQGSASQSARLETKARQFSSFLLVLAPSRGEEPYPYARTRRTSR